MTTLRAELIAGKIESGWLDDTAAAHPEWPRGRVNELLWFLQHLSRDRDGLKNFVARLVTSNPAAFGNEPMIKIGVPKGERYSLSECFAVWKSELDNEWKRLHEPREKASEDAAFDEWLSLSVDGALSAETIKDYDRKAIAHGAARFNYPFLKSFYTAEAEEKLPGYLAALCVEKETRLCGPKYCPALPELLFAAMDRHAEETGKAIAQTAITRRVFRELDFALSQNVPVPIIGDSRIGKTSPALNWCAMRPGRARLITVPESNRMRDFIEAHADALGIDHTQGVSLAALTAQVKYVHKLSGLMAIYDESTFLVPSSYTRSTPPPRIDFVRFQVIDRHLPCAFFATPQSYRQSLDQYVATTGYRIEQWLGRIAPAVILPPDLSREDMLAVARIHFPNLPQGYLKLIIARAMQTEGYIKNLEFAARRSLFIARENGRSQPNQEDVETAIEEMMPAPKVIAARPSATIRNTDLAVLKASLNRVARPVKDQDLSDGSLESSCPERGGMVEHVAG